MKYSDKVKYEIMVLRYRLDSLSKEISDPIIKQAADRLNQLNDEIKNVDEQENSKGSG